MNSILIGSSENGRASTKHYSEIFRTLPHPAMTICGVAPNATYDPHFEFPLYDVEDMPTVELAAINATIKAPVVMRDVEVGES